MLALKFSLAILTILSIGDDFVLASEISSNSLFDSSRNYIDNLQDLEERLSNGTVILPDLRQMSLVESLFGQVAKTVVYGGATFIQLNTRILCPLLSFETHPDDTQHPTLFVFNNPDNREQAYRIFADDEIAEPMIREAQFDPDQMTVIFVHGWLGGINNELWLAEAKNAALRSLGGQQQKIRRARSSKLDRWPDEELQAHWKHRKSGWSQWESIPEDDTSSSAGYGGGSLPFGEKFRPNVIVVDWSEFADGSLFSATKNSLKVSRRLARLLSQLVLVGQLKPERMHCFGHSIGAHICGQAARYAFPAQTWVAARGGSSAHRANGRPSARNRFGRITALDPGGFCYERGIRNESTFLGLRPSDALLVDAYYTNRSPFGNRFQVAQYNVRVNSGNLQPACSVWRNPELASEYFRTAVRFLMGDTKHADILVCDHYFATRFAEQLLVPSCSYVAYACDSYRNFLRGQCGKCDSSRQCYTMDAEYQRPEPSVANALEKISNHSSLFDSFNTGRDAPGEPIGGVPYADRPIYYMRVGNEAPYCSITFRIRVLLDPIQIDPRGFRSDWLKLRLLGYQEEVVSVRDASSGRLVDTISLHGPWLSNGVRAALEKQHLYGVDNRTLTALIELAPRVTLSQAPITDIVVIYDSDNYRRSTTGNPVESIELDYLSSPDLRIRSQNSRSFDGYSLRVFPRHI